MLVNEQHADDDIAFKDMFSYKMNHAGWRYQVSLAIQSGYIVHVNNGTAPGVLNDLNAVRMSDLPALLRKNKEKLVLMMDIGGSQIFSPLLTQDFPVSSDVR